MSDEAIVELDLEEDAGDMEESWEDSDKEYDPKRKYTGKQLEEIADAMLREDANRELCRQCREKNPKSLPYGQETGEIEWKIQTDKEGVPQVDDEGHTLYVGFPELVCDEGHRWYQGEGPRRNINGKDPILFEPHLYNRKRREIHVKDGVPDPAFTMDRWGKHPVQGMYYRCVDMETEALTPSGWRTAIDLVIGEPIWTYDRISDTCAWTPLLEVYQAEYSGLMQVLESQNLSARTTPGHSWIVASERDKTLRFATTDLKPRQCIPLPRTPQINTPTGRESLFELLGWVITDGTYRQNKSDALVYQALHNPKVGALRECLVANGVNPEPQFIDDNNIGRWAIPTRVGRPLRALTSDIKSFASIDWSAYKPTEYDALWRGAMYGDGYRRKDTHAEMVTTKAQEADGIQALRTVIGGGSRLKHYHRPQSIMPHMYVVTQKHSQWAYVRPALQEPERYDGEVWCPTTTTGFWVARRNGKTFVTGNTHPQGRKVNTNLQRRKNGASYYR